MKLKSFLFLLTVCVVAIVALAASITTYFVLDSKRSSLLVRQAHELRQYLEGRLPPIARAVSNDEYILAIQLGVLLESSLRERNAHVTLRLPENLRHSFSEFRGVDFSAMDGGSLMEIGENVILIEEPIRVSGVTKGKIVLKSIPRLEEYGKYRNSVLVALALGYVFLSIFGFLIFRVVVRHFTSPLDFIVKRIPSVQRFIQDGGALPYLGYEGSFYEFQILASSLENLAAEAYLQSADAASAKAELESERAVANLAKAMAHDVRRPLSMSRILVETLRNIQSLTEMKEFLEECLPELERAGQSVDNLLSDVLLFGPQEIPLQVSALDLNATIRRVLRSCFSAEERIFKISLIIQTNKMALADEGKLDRVLGNLIVNAIQAAKVDLRLHIEVYEVNQQICIAIENFGTLLDEQTRRDMCKPFFTRGKKNGTGLGLAICRKITEQHGGRLEILSFMRGHDSVVRVEVRLPAADGVTVDGPKTETIDSQSLTRMRAAPSISSGQGQLSLSSDDLDAPRRALVSGLCLLKRPLSLWMLDDNSTYALGLRKMLASDPEVFSQIQFTHFSDVGTMQEALASGSAFDALLLDLDLSHEMEGLTVLSELRNRKMGQSLSNQEEDEPVVVQHGNIICVHTNRTDPDVHRSCFHAGADLILAKPLHVAQVYHLLAAACECLSEDAAARVDQ